VNLTEGQIEQVLKYLSVENPAPVIRQSYKWSRTPVPYRLDPGRIRRLTQKRELEWQEVQGYVDTSDCLMAYLEWTLDDPHAAPCGKCANCIGRPEAGRCSRWPWQRHPQTVEHADSHHPGGFAADGSLLKACPGRPQTPVARGGGPVCPMAERAGADPRCACFLVAAIG